MIVKVSGHDVMILHVLDDEELDFTYAGTTKFEGLEEAGEVEDLAIGAVEPVGLAVTLGPGPFVEAVDGDKAAVFLEGAPESRALLDGLGPGIDLLVARLCVPGPVVDQSPAGNLDFPLLAVGGHDEVVARGSDVEAGLVFGRQLFDGDAHVPGQLLRLFVAESDAAAHGRQCTGGSKEREQTRRGQHHPALRG